MKANELMIGDYITFKDCKDEIIPIEIVELMGAEALVRIYREDTYDIIDIDDEIVGIPLTPEILEKNGFDLNGIPTEKVPVEERDYSDDTYVWQERDEWGNLFTVSLYDQNDGLGTWSCEVVDCPKGRMDIEIKSVHELQHALRLCGITKEITI